MRPGAAEEAPVTLVDWARGSSWASEAFLRRACRFGGVGYTCCVTPAQSPTEQLWAVGSAAGPALWTGPRVTSGAGYTRGPCGNKHEQAKRRSLKCPPSSPPSQEQRGGQLCADKVPAHSSFRFGRSWCRVVLPGALRSSWTPRFAGSQRAVTQREPRACRETGWLGVHPHCTQGTHDLLHCPPPEPET